MIDVTCELQVYEVDGKKTKGLKSKNPQLVIRSHWNRPEFVCIDFGEVTWTVAARDIQTAIDNASNTNRHG